jgi:hypothetical protein
MTDRPTDSAGTPDAAGMRDAADARFPAQEPSPVSACPNSHWIEIELLDNDGAPQAGVGYEILGAGGAIIGSGALDQDGRARVDGLDWQSCTVTFPEIDGRVWTPR